MTGFFDSLTSLYTREALEFRACGRGGAMHPKGTCSASLHCVGIAPYEVARGAADNDGRTESSERNT